MSVGAICVENGHEKNYDEMKADQHQATARWMGLGLAALITVGGGAGLYTAFFETQNQVRSRFPGLLDD